MPKGFYELEIAKIKRETQKTVSISFTIPEEIKDLFKYSAGQYLTLSIEIGGEELRRSYSLSSAMGVDELPTITIKEVYKGKVSSYLNQVVMEGMKIWAMPPMGKFIADPFYNDENTYVLFGGGSGVTPLFSILKTVMNNPKGKAHLYYCNTDADNIVFNNELNEWVAKNPERLKITHSLDNPPAEWEGEKGYLTSEKISNFLFAELGLGFPTAKYYICGPGPMMKLTHEALQSAGIRDENIFTEYFAAAENKEETKSDTTDSSEEESIKGDKTMLVDVFGEQKEIEVKEGETILIAAQNAGMDPPYSCTVGVCTTCRAKVLKGKVHMIEREGLSDAEIEDGYILTCQSHPSTENVELIFE